MGGAEASVNPFNNPDIVHLYSSYFLDEFEKEDDLYSSVVHIMVSKEDVEVIFFS